MNKIFAFLLCFVALSSQGQMVDVIEKPSGYFGKRLLLGVSSTFSLSRDLQKPTTERPDYDHLTLNRDFSISLYYTAKSKMSVGFLVGNSATSFDIYNNLDGVYGTQITDVNGKKYTLQSINGSPDIKDAMVGIDFRFFRSSKGAFSPLGQYFNIGLIGHQYSIDLSPLSFNVFQEKSKTHSTISNASETAVKVLPEIVAGAGISQPIFKVLLIDLGIKFGYLMVLEDSAPSVAGLSGSLESAIYNRLMFREILNFNVGLSYPF